MAKKILSFLTIITGLLYAQFGDPDVIFGAPPGCNGKLSWFPKEPKEGELVNITFEVTSGIDVSELHVVFLPIKSTKENVKFVGPTGYDCSIRKGETKTFATQVRFYKPIITMWINARARDLEQGFKMPSGKTEYVADLAHFEFTLVFDESTKTFVGRNEYNRRRSKPKLLPPEYTYDVVADMHTGDVLPEAEAKKLRAQIDSLKQFDSTLTDEESFEMLHDIEVQMLVRYGISKKEESVPILINARKLMREQNLSKWEAVDKVVEETKSEKGKLNFFRPGRGSNADGSVDSDSTPTRQIDITITGTIKYKKHLIDKDTGLDTTTVDMPLRVL